MTSRGRWLCALLQLLLCSVLAEASWQPGSATLSSAVEVQMPGDRRRGLRRCISVAEDSLSSDSLLDQLDPTVSARLHILGNNFGDLVDIRAEYSPGAPWPLKGQKRRKPKLSRTVEYL